MLNVFKTRSSSQNATNSLACALPSAAVTEKRSLVWVMASFLLCPCHLPLTLGLLGTVLGGTAAGALLRQYPLVAGAIVTLAWGIGTLRGLSQLRRAAQYAKAVAVNR
jgi:Fe2+ transport system protein B